MVDDFAPPLERAAQRLERAVEEFFAVHDVTLGTAEEREAIRLRGQLRVPAAEAFPEIQRRFRLLGYTPFLRHDPESDLKELLAVPGTMPEKSDSRLWVHALLFAATILTTLYVGAGMSEARPPDDLWWPLLNLWEGWPFSVSLLSILVAHEMGHYVVNRFHGLAATLPYFIPLPIPDFLGNVFGTMGAVILAKGRMTNRRVMLDIGAAGPIVGLVVAIPVVLIGLSLSHVEPLPVDHIYSMEGNSLLYLLLKFALFRQWLPSGGVDVMIHPVAFAGWAGILVTSLNLIPAGQLDGGHVLYSLLGERAGRFTWPIIGALAVLGAFVWPGWILWAGLVFFFGRGHPAPLDEVTRLDTARKLVAVLTLLLLVLTFTPIPLTYVIPDGYELQEAAVGALALGCGAVLLLRRRAARRRR
jgi:membrane-associated protease RseP (regulator of RpoE activity)